MLYLNLSVLLSLALLTYFLIEFKARRKAILLTTLSLPKNRFSISMKDLNLSEEMELYILDRANKIAEPMHLICGCVYFASLVLILQFS